MEVKDLMDLKALEGSGISPYEQYKMSYMQSKHHTSGIGVAGLVLGTVGTAAAVGAWIFAPMYGASKANAAKEIANAQMSGIRDLLLTQAQTLAAERAERIAGDQTITQTVTDTQTGSQASQLTAQQAAELSAVNSVMQQTYSDFVTGRASLNPTPVSLYSAPQPCACPGCGCNG